ncbi:Uncharacterised protein [uncultured archaeon]|nr:Uncharacterised protein [uncultured archaeon]
MKAELSEQILRKGESDLKRYMDVMGSKEIFNAYRFILLGVNTQSALCQKTNLTRSPVSMQLKALKAQSLIITEGGTKGNPLKLYVNKNNFLTYPFTVYLGNQLDNEMSHSVNPKMSKTMNRYLKKIDPTEAEIKEVFVVNKKMREEAIEKHLKALNTSSNEYKDYLRFFEKNKAQVLAVFCNEKTLTDAFKAVGNFCYNVNYYAKNKMPEPNFK